MDGAKNLVAAITEAQCPLPSLDKKVVEVLLNWLQPVSIYKLYRNKKIHNVFFLTKRQKKLNYLNLNYK